MTDEEKKVLDKLKNIDKGRCLMLKCPVVENNIEKQLKIIELNITIRKQSKEIEKLNAQRLREISNTKYWISKDTIKEMIKEIDKDENISISDFIEYAKEYAKQKLQSLLEEKE